ncbi:hypothetical protein FPHYL_5904 [Fusarium phyllophilum]|uniref:Uncharacterized protein n=1 Tax=Fusarium phyllophilum TaxID=47803 RepID=A0A8H5JVL9_9HYPO|nr:hypothetical protein FPHYL_5904 [Fusarium phyllophilum]
MRRHRRGPLRSKGTSQDKQAQLVDYIINHILAKSAAGSVGVQEDGNVQQSSELTQGMIKILNDVYADPGKIGAKNLIDWFMTNGGKEPRRRYQAEVVNHFCHSNELQELQSNSSSSSSSSSSSNISTRKLCLIDDRTVNGIASTSNGNRTPLTSHGMYVRLMEKPQGLVTNELSFHLPFYSWQLTQHEPRDIRMRRDGSPLRKVHNMSCLRGSSPTVPTIDYLCQAQIAICITPMDGGIWTGYCFADTYFQPEDERQCVEDYCDRGMQVDPFTTGKHDADMPILNPDDYFLISLQHQLVVFKDEWMNTAKRFKERVETYVDEFDFALASKESQQPLAWLRHARRKLTELVVCLETTIDCWDNFTYPDHMQTRYGRQSMVSIEQTFAEVRNCLKELYNIRTLCDEHERTLNLHNIDEQYRISRMQAQVAESTQVLSCFLLYVVSPITLAAAILSMQEEAIPDFLGPTKLSFFLLTPMLILLVSLVARLVQHWDKVQLYMSHPGNWVQARKRNINNGIV